MPVIIALIALLLLGIIVFPFLNKLQFKKMSEEQKVMYLQKQAKGLISFKNISDGRSGTLYYVKNKRKIYAFPWELSDGRLVCTRDNLFEKWDYPEDKPVFTDEEITQVLSEIENFNKKNRIKLYLDYGNQQEFKYDN